MPTGDVARQFSSFAFYRPLEISQYCAFKMNSVRGGSKPRIRFTDVGPVIREWKSRGLQRGHLVTLMEEELSGSRWTVHGKKLLILGSIQGCDGTCPCRA